MRRRSDRVDVLLQAADSKREQFRRYLEKSGVLDTLTKGKAVRGGAERRAVTPWPAPSRRRAPASGGRQCGAGGPRALGSAALLSEWQPGAHVLGFQPAGLRSDNGVR